MEHKPLTARLVRVIIASLRNLENIEREPLPDGRKWTALDEVIRRHLEAWAHPEHPAGGA